MVKSKVKSQKSKVQAKSQNFKSRLFILVSILCTIAILGCGGFKEGLRGFAGISTKVLEEDKPSAISRSFNYDYNTCYLKVKGIIKEIGAYIYAKDNEKKMIAIYVSGQDTTPVGLFFEEVDKANTKIQVSSPSAYAKELISEKIFSALEKSLKAKKVEVQLDAIEGKTAK
jgi:hypothetical protein